ncbi:hypothetical protein [Nocardioides sp.]|uniref:hypothetical protein n=1 Tax=Nocardioides sp. TaxID=35761 RepID=UPI002B9B3394|nr:hypothetical protein [Nocardioides sp.]HXH78334.1 hypothetical protein [Nocardioides sp.]
MARSEGLDAQMAQLRSQVAGLREQTAAFRDRMEQAKAQLQPRAERARADRAEAQQELRRQFEQNDLPDEDRALVARVLKRETTWHDVMSGADEHATAVDYRARFATQFNAAVEQVAAEDDELAQALSDAQQAAGDRPGSPG